MRTFKIVFIFVLIALVVGALLPVQAQNSTPPKVGLRPDAPDYAKHGPFWVGTREFTIPDKDGKRPLPVTVWYPALNPDGKPEEVTYNFDYPPFNSHPMTIEGHALLDAAPDKGKAPYPLIVFSHALWDWRTQSAYYTEHLASYGFVVIAPDHIGNTTCNYGQPWQASFIYRPLDAKRVFDYAVSLAAKGGALEGLIDTEHIGVTGHSSGGNTSLAVAPGTQLDLRLLREFCSSGQDILGLCTGKTTPDELAELAGLKSAPDGLWPSFGDQRVRGIVALAPGPVDVVFGKDGLKGVTIPVMLMGGTADTTAAPKDNSNNVLWANQYLGSSQKSLIMFENAAHYLFVNSCSVFPWIAAEPYNIGWFCSDPVWDMDRAHDLINHFATAFLLDVLKGDKDAHKALLPDAVKFVGIQYTTTMK